MGRVEPPLVESLGTVPQVARTPARMLRAARDLLGERHTVVQRSGHAPAARSKELIGR